SCALPKKPECEPPQCVAGSPRPSQRVNMTRETKIGLLVGLAFIIVIGILLSDHMTSTTQPPQAALAESASNVRESVTAPAPTNPGPASITSVPQITPANQVLSQNELRP